MRRSLMFVTITIVFAGLLMSRTAEASSITLFTRTFDGNPPGSSDSDSATGTVSTTTNLSTGSSSGSHYVQNNYTADLSALASAFVRAVSGSLVIGVDAGVFDSAVIAPGPVSAFTATGQAAASAQVTDHLTVVGGPSAGFLAFYFSLSGSVYANTTNPGNSVSQAAAAANFFLNSNTTSGLFANISAASQSSFVGSTGAQTSSFPASMVMVIPYTNSLASMLLHLDVSLNTHQACGVGPMTCTEDAIGDFAHTLLLNYIQVQDSLGNVIPGAYVVGDTFTYNNAAQAAAVPEPASLLLLGTGLLAIAAKVRQNRRRTL